MSQDSFSWQSLHFLSHLTEVDKMEKLIRLKERASRLECSNRSRPPRPLVSVHVVGGVGKTYLSRIDWSGFWEAGMEIDLENYEAIHPNLVRPCFVMEWNHGVASAHYDIASEVFVYGSRHELFWACGLRWKGEGEK